MRIIHFSDIHAGGVAEDWMAYLDKRWVGVFNYTWRRQFQHDLSRLEKAVEYIIAARPDLAVCTGDLTSTGQPGEFEKVRVVLDRLLDAGVPMLYVPGNHDFYVYRTKCVNAMKSMVERLNGGRYTFKQLPCLIQEGELDFILVNECWPSNLLSSHGYLRPDYARQIERLCAEEKRRPRVLIGHYPLIEKHPLLRMRHRLYGQKPLLRLLKNGDIDLSLCGHVHRPYSHLDDTGRGESCAGSVTKNSCMSLIEYDRASDVFAHRQLSLD